MVPVWLVTVRLSKVAVVSSTIGFILADGQLKSWVGVVTGSVVTVNVPRPLLVLKVSDPVVVVVVSRWPLGSP